MVWSLRKATCNLTYFWLAGNEGMEENKEAAILLGHAQRLMLGSFPSFLAEQSSLLGVEVV